MAGWLNCDGMQSLTLFRRWFLATECLAADSLYMRKALEKSYDNE
jgi:hypothetical protein